MAPGTNVLMINPMNNPKPSQSHQPQHQPQRQQQQKRQPSAMSSSSMNPGRNPGGGRGRPRPHRDSSGGGGPDTVYDWEREYRAYLNNSIKELSDQVKTMAQQQQQTAIVIERIMGRLDDLEERPSEARAIFGVANQSLGSLIGVGALVVAVISTLLQHVTFH
jgi:hypothetical protein